VRASFVGGAADGAPAITRNDWGDGAAWYLATLPDADSYRRLMAQLLEEAGVEPAASVEGDLRTLELVRRRADDRSYLFVVNHGSEAVTVRASGTDLITGADAADDVTVPGGSVRIIREEAIA
jgi:beta-galactosidase